MISELAWAIFKVKIGSIKRMEKEAQEEYDAFVNAWRARTNKPVPPPMSIGDKLWNWKFTPVLKEPS